MKLFCLLFLLCPWLLVAQHPDDARWSRDFVLPGVEYPESSYQPSATIKALDSLQDYIVVAGAFSYPARNIALWNTKTRMWEDMDGGVWKGNNWSSTTYPSVERIFVDGDDIWVFGYFGSAGTLAISNGIAKWNIKSRTWSAVDNSVRFNALSSCVRYKNSILFSGYASLNNGVFTNNIVQWDGSSFSFLSTDTSHRVLANTMVVFKNELYVTGAFTNPTIKNLAKWSGTDWQQVLDTVSVASLQAIAKVRGVATNGTTLFIYGRFDTALVQGKAIPALNLLRYDGSTWSGMIKAMNENYAGITRMNIVGEDLFVADGSLSSVNNIAVNGIAKWDAAQKTWKAVGSGIHSYWDNQGIFINSMMYHHNSLYVAGQFPLAGSSFVNNIARFDESTSQWQPLAHPFPLAPNNRVSLFTDQGSLLGIGEFLYAGDTKLNYIGTFDGKAWHDINGGFPGQFDYTLPQYQFYALHTSRGIGCFERMGNDMYFGGLFNTINGSPFGGIIRFTNGVSDNMQGGISQSRYAQKQWYIPPAVRTMLRIGNDLYIGGDFVNAGGIRVNSIAKWNGTTWSALGKGIDAPSTPSAVVYSMGADTKGNLYVAGSFPSVESKSILCHGLAKWNGSAWFSLGKPTADSVINYQSIAMKGDTMYVAGAFVDNNMRYYASIKRWDGTTWSDLDTLLAQSATLITSIALKDSLLYITGIFRHIGSLEVNNVAVWNFHSKTWSALGSGFRRSIFNDTTTGLWSPNIQSIAFVGDTVYFSGDFSYAGDKPSFRMAAWLPIKPTSVEQQSSNAQDLRLTVSPNPTSSTAHLHFSLPSSTPVHIALYDMLGREVLTLCDSMKETGSYSATIDCSALGTGMYYCRLLAQDTLLSTPLSIVR